MKQYYWITASILSADFARLGEEARAVLKAGANGIHFDVMDNHYVPNLTVGPVVCHALRHYGIQGPINVHLMVTPVDSLISSFAKAGATFISFHPEASEDVNKSLALIRELGCYAGLAFNPETPLDYLTDNMDKVDMIILMSVNPGFAGQAFIPSTLEKIKQARTLIDNSGFNIRLEVDGGITPDNIREIADCGADTFVSGSAIFQSSSYKKTIKAMQSALKPKKWKIF